jgi:hypothetical protein
MKNGKGEDTCLRCLKCNPMPNGNKIVKAKKENVRVDVPWTEERIRDIVRDELENWHQTTVLTKQKEGWGEDEPVVVATDVAVPDKVDWRGQAKKLGVSLVKETGGARTKASVLEDIEAKLMSQAG